MLILNIAQKYISSLVIYVTLTQIECTPSSWGFQYFPLRFPHPISRCTFLIKFLRHPGFNSGARAPGRKLGHGSRNIEEIDHSYQKHISMSCDGVTAEEMLYIRGPSLLHNTDPLLNDVCLQTQISILFGEIKKNFIIVLIDN